jgi:hypothetical protein
MLFNNFSRKKVKDLTYRMKTDGKNQTTIGNCNGKTMSLMMTHGDQITQMMNLRKKVVDQDYYNH